MKESSGIKCLIMLKDLEEREVGYFLPGPKIHFLSHNFIHLKITVLYLSHVLAELIGRAGRLHY